MSAWVLVFVEALGAAEEETTEVVSRTNVLDVLDAVREEDGATTKLIRRKVVVLETLGSAEETTKLLPRVTVTEALAKVELEDDEETAMNLLKPRLVVEECGTVEEDDSTMKLFR